MSYYHLAVIPHRQAQKYGKRTVLKYRDTDKKWKNISWRKFSETIKRIAWAMAELGVEEGDRIGTYSQNTPEYLMCDFATFANRCVCVPIYATSSPDQVEYIVKEADIHVLFVGDQFQYNNAFKVQQRSETLKHMIVYNREVVFHPLDKTSIYYDDFIATGENSHAEVTVKVRMKNRREDDAACIIYTSGTTGEPKGVVLPHSSYRKVFEIHDIRLTKISDKDISMNFLPLAHVFEKSWCFYAIYRGITIAINKDAKEVQKSIKQIKPTVMCSVPRFWEKVYAGIFEKIEESKGLMRWIYNDAIKTGHKFKIQYQIKGKKPPFGTKLKYILYNNTIYRAVKTVIGIQHGNMFPCAGAPLSDNVNEFLQSMNIPIIVGYGLTETNATVSFYPYRNFIINSVGEIMPELEVKIDPSNNEILVKGKTLMREYYKKPNETVASFTEDGFFRTGDAGRLEGNVLYLTERLKDLFKTANGKYIAPQAIEMAVGEDKFIETVVIIADQRKFVSALIVPEYPVLEEYAQKHEIHYRDMDELVNNPDILRMIDGRIEIKQAKFAPFEKIKRYRLLPEPFTMEGGELTNTLKVKRKFVNEKYKDLIDSMYKD